MLIERAMGFGDVPIFMIPLQGKEIIILFDFNKTIRAKKSS